MGLWNPLPLSVIVVAGVKAVFGFHSGRVCWTLVIMVQYDLRVYRMVRVVLEEA